MEPSFIHQLDSNPSETNILVSVRWLSSLFAEGQRISSCSVLWFIILTEK